MVVYCVNGIIALVTLCLITLVTLCLITLVTLCLIALVTWSIVHMLMTSIHTIPMEAKYPHLTILHNKARPSHPLQSLEHSRPHDADAENHHLYAGVPLQREPRSQVLSTAPPRFPPRILVEEGYCQLPAKEVDIQTPCGTYRGVEYPTNFCAVSIMRSGDSLLQAFIEAFPEAPIGKVLIQRDESTPDKRARVRTALRPTSLVLLQQAAKGHREPVCLHL